LSYFRPSCPREGSSDVRRGYPSLNLCVGSLQVGRVLWHSPCEHRIAHQHWVNTPLRGTNTREYNRERQTTAGDGDIICML
jgi:hypothetical protein